MRMAAFACCIAAITVSQQCRSGVALDDGAVLVWSSAGHKRCWPSAYSTVHADRDGGSTLRAGSGVVARAVDVATCW